MPPVKACRNIEFLISLITRELPRLLTGLLQTGRSKPMPIVLYGTQYWDEVIDLKAMARWGTINPADLELFYRADKPEAAFAYSQRELQPTLIMAKRQ